MQYRPVRLRFMPSTRLGQWAVASGIVLVALLVLELIFAFAIKGDPSVIEASPFLTVLANILSIGFTIASLLSFFTGMIAIIKYKEWLVLKSLSVLYFIALLLFMLGELLFPH